MSSLQSRVDSTIQLKTSSRQAIPQLAILGAGPAGAGAAFQAAARGLARTTVLEANAATGGNAGSFDLHGVRCDYGSHRLHPKVAPHILQDLRILLGDDLLLRPRHGRIRLRGKWIHFPLKPLDLALKLPKRFALGVASDSVRKSFLRSANGKATFATVLERGLGRTICRDFYFPFARKLWGVEPEELSIATAQRRVSGSSLGRMIGKVLRQAPGFKSPVAGKFYYPRKGYGQISEALWRAAESHGASFQFNAPVIAVNRDGNRVVGVQYRQSEREHSLATDMVWSTIPITHLVRGMRPAAPADVLAAASELQFRGMMLIYLVLDQDRFSQYDAYYFPDCGVPISRLSEPKVFRDASEPIGRTVICAELPCDPGDSEWTLTDEELGRRLCEWMAMVGLPVKSTVLSTAVRRLPQAYPVYRAGYERPFEIIDQWLGQLDGLVSLGRQGLFAHDNAHHTLEMAYAAADCLAPDGSFDKRRWAECRREFEAHVVED